MSWKKFRNKLNDVFVSAATGGISDAYAATKEDSVAGGIDRALDPGGSIDSALRKTGEYIDPKIKPYILQSFPILGSIYGPVLGMAGSLIASKLGGSTDTAAVQNALKVGAMGAAAKGAGVLGNYAGSTVASSTGSQALGSTVSGATSGAVTGAGSALASGDNVGEGALLGAAAGGISGASSSAVKGGTEYLTGQGVNQGVANTATNTVVGAGKGALTSAVSGNNAGDGALQGALQGGITSGINNTLQPTTEAGRSATAALGNAAYQYAKQQIMPTQQQQVTLQRFTTSVPQVKPMSSGPTQQQRAMLQYLSR